MTAPGAVSTMQPSAAKAALKAAIRLPLRDSALPISASIPAGSSASPWASPRTPRLLGRLSKREWRPESRPLTKTRDGPSSPSKAPAARSADKTSAPSAGGGNSSSVSGARLVYFQASVRGARQPIRAPPAALVAKRIKPRQARSRQRRRCGTGCRIVEGNGPTAGHGAWPPLRPQRSAQARGQHSRGSRVPARARSRPSGRCGRPRARAPCPARRDPAAADSG